MRPIESGVRSSCWLDQLMEVAVVEQRKQPCSGPWSSADDDDDQRLEMTPSAVAEADTVLVEYHCSNHFPSFRMLLK